MIYEPHCAARAAEANLDRGERVSFRLRSPRESERRKTWRATEAGERIEVPKPAPRIVARESEPAHAQREIHLIGEIPPELWNRFGMKIIPKLRGTASTVVASIDLRAEVDGKNAPTVKEQIRELVAELGLEGRVRIE